MPGDYKIVWWKCYILVPFYGRLMVPIEQGAKIAVEKCMVVKPEDYVLIVADEDSKDIGIALRKASLEITNHVRFFNVDLPSYGGRPLKQMPDGLREAILKATVTFFVAGAREGELATLREPFLKLIKAKARHAHMVGVSNEIMESGMCVDYEVVQKITENVYRMVKDADEIRVTSPAGTDFIARLDPSMKWIPCSGVVTKTGEWDNLPSGEVFTAPLTLEGRLVVDGTVGDWLGEKYNEIVDFSETPLIIDVETRDGGSYVTYCECENKELLEDFTKYINSEPCASRVGELGIGTNIFLEKIVGNILQDEKLPTIHVAFGDPYHEKTGATWSCHHHIDLLMLKCSIIVDGIDMMTEGEYLKIITG